MAKCKAEFLVEPFTEGSQGEHVVAAIAAISDHGLEPDVGPFGTTVEGDPTLVLTALDAMVRAALDNGATRVAITTTVVA